MQTFPNDGEAHHGSFTRNDCLSTGGNYLADRTGDILNNWPGNINEHWGPNLVLLSGTNETVAYIPPHESERGKYIIRLSFDITKISGSEA